MDNHKIYPTLREIDRRVHDQVKHICHVIYPIVPKNRSVFLHGCGPDDSITCWTYDCAGRHVAACPHIGVSLLFWFESFSVRFFNALVT